MSENEVTPDLFTVDYVGEPGRRSFFLYASGRAGTFTFALEKAQVAVLADKLRELLVMIDRQDTIRTAASARDPALSIAAPSEPQFRIGAMGLAYEEDHDVVVVLAQPAEEEPDEEGAEESGVRFLLRRDQVRAFILHALAVVGEGRPTCQFCGLPMDPSGHLCPVGNGHRTSE